jgi:hypothetical protein
VRVVDVFVVLSVEPVERSRVCNASIYFNKQCSQKQLIPNYAKIKVPNTSPAAIYTLHKAQKLRIKDELKYLYAKKRQLNRQIYHLHISLANTWGSSWSYILHTIEEKLKKTLQPKYKNLDNKLAQTQTKTPTDTHTFFPRVVNKTNILFSNSELKLLEKGPKYNIHSHKRNWLTTLALEAETAITHLPSTDRDYFRKQVAIRIEELHNKPTPHKNTPRPQNLKVNSNKTQIQ